MKKTAVILCAVLLLAAAGCTALDVVGTDSARAFGAVLDVRPAGENDDGWNFDAPDGGARFSWNNGSAGISLDGGPFIAAGLDIDAFQNAGGVVVNGIIYFGKDFTDAEKSKTAPLDDYKNIVGINRAAIGYHTALDHYNIDIGGGNMFEWAKDMAANDKDVVFVLNPEPFIDAGVDPNAIEGWTLAKVPVDIDGKASEVDKLLKAFDL